MNAQKKKLILQNKHSFEEPCVEIIAFGADDVITTSSEPSIGEWDQQDLDY